MKKLLAMATLVAVGAGTAGVSALDNVELRGSDTLFGITTDILLNCPDADPGGFGPPGVTYVGGGSSGGELRLLETSNLGSPSTCNFDINPPGAPDGRFECQTVSPMSRFLTNAQTCQFPVVGSQATDNADQAEGVAYSLDGLSIVASGIYDGTCNEDTGTAGADPDDCNAATDPSAGLAYNKTIAVQDLDGTAGIQCTTCVGGNYTLAGGANAWRDVLRIIYTGLPTGENDTFDRSCNGDLRRTLISNWSNLFQNSCTSTASESCTGALRHAFRRDDESGTTDVFLTLIAVGTPSLANNTSPFCNVSRAGDDVADDPDATDDATGDTPWGGVLTVGGQTGQFPGGWPGPYPTGGTWRAGWANSLNATTGVGSATGTAGRAYYPDFQDNDPVRSACAGTFDLPPNTTSPAEQVCRAFATELVPGATNSFVGTLGVVLPINPPTNLLTDAERYPSTPCTQNVFRPIGQAPVVGAPILDPDYPAGSIRTNNTNARCPNGDVPIALSAFNPNQAKCFVPVAGTSTTGSPQCLNGRDNMPVCADNPAINPQLGCARVTAFGLPVTGFRAGDGRVYNLHLRNATGGYQLDSRGREIVGAYYRIHSTRTLLTPPTCVGDTCCQSDSATQQIGCLVQASPCSIGFAGLEATDVQLNATGGLQSAISLKVDAKEATAACVRNLINPPNAFYPLSRELFINSLFGFQHAETGTQERELTECFSATAQSSLPGATAAAKLTFLEGLIVGRGFITRGPGNFPVCKDFNQTTCPAAAHTSPNTDACTNNPVGIPNDDPLVP
jgi:hypothetical protein